MRELLFTASVCLFDVIATPTDRMHQGLPNNPTNIENKCSNNKNFFVFSKSKFEISFFIFFYPPKKKLKQKKFYLSWKYVYIANQACWVEWSSQNLLIVIEDRWW